MKNMMEQMKMMGGHGDNDKCPLTGASKAVSMIDGAAMLVIGTEECAYYTRSTLNMKGSAENCFSVVLDKNDVTFGSIEKVRTAIDELMQEIKPKSLFLITTCVVEVIGDDFSALEKELSEQYSIPVRVIKTNHYQGKDAEHGYELVSEASKDFAKMNKRPGILGQIFGGRKDKNQSGNGMDRSKMLANMSDEQMLAMARQKMGNKMSDEQLLAMIKMKLRSK